MASSLLQQLYEVEPGHILSAHTHCDTDCTFFLFWTNLHEYRARIGYFRLFYTIVTLFLAVELLVRENKQFEDVTDVGISHYFLT